MPTDKQRDELRQRLLSGETPNAAASAMGLHHSTADRVFAKLKLEAATGQLGYGPVLPGFAIRRVSRQTGPGGELRGTSVVQGPSRGPEYQALPGHRVKGESVLLDADDRVVQRWVKTKDETQPEDVASIIKEAFAEFEGRGGTTPAPLHPSNDLLTLFPCNDWHLNMLAWGEEVGENWDLRIAEDVIGRSVEEAVERSPASAFGVVLGGGDLLHADNQENRTARSGNALDCDGRYPKGLMAACRLMVRTTDACLRRHQNVIVRILKGNHDEHSAIAVAYFLLAWYRDEPRVTVDVDPSLFWWFRFGKVLLGASHGHSVKLQDMPSIMAHRRAEDWGATTFRYVHGFHIHHKSKLATEGGGVICESHQAPIPQDAWHFGAGFLSGRSLQTITYHRRYGEVSRARVAILDAAAA